MAKKKTRSYHLPDGTYFDVTTGRTYQPKDRCEICESYWDGLTVHHYLDQQKCMRDLKDYRQGTDKLPPYIWSREFILENQKLFTLCVKCHKEVERKGNEKKGKNGRLFKDYLYRNEEKPKVVTKPKMIVVKKGETK